MKTRYAFVPLAVGLMLAGCQCGRKTTTPTEDSIIEAAYNYSMAMANYNVDKAIPFATDETQKTTLMRAKQLIQAVGDEYIKSDTPAKIEITDVEITSDTTAYAIYHKTTPLKNFSDTIQLRKRDGKWLAHALMMQVSKPAEPQQ